MLSLANIYTFNYIFRLYSRLNKLSINRKENTQFCGDILNSLIVNI